MSTQRQHRPTMTAAGIFLAALLMYAGAEAEPVPTSGTNLIPHRTIAYKPTLGQATPFQVGDPLTVKAFSFRLVGGGHYLTTTTCRLVGEHCYIFVEDVVWGTSRVSEGAIDSLVTAFDESTRRDSTRGIFEVDTDLFGPAPDVDGDPRIVIVLLDILDSPFTGSTFVGYFDVENEAEPISREILYLDVNPLDLNSDLAKATLAHELQHMIHWFADPDEEKWLDEGCSEYAELAAGFRDTGPDAGSSYLEVPNTSLTQWDDLPFDFDQTFLFTTYFVQRLGEEMLVDLVARTENGTEGLDLFLDGVGSSESFASLFADWAAALYLDGDDDRGLQEIEVGPLHVDTLSVVDGATTRTLRLWGVDYQALDVTGGVSVTVEGALDNTLAAVLIGESSEGNYVKRQDVGIGESARMNSFGTEDRVLAVARTSGIVEDYTVTLTPLAGDDPAASDFDANGLVDFGDFLDFVTQFGRTLADLDYDPSFDLDGDARIGFGDFLVFVVNFGEVIP